jgi:hypothetical protein
MLQFYNLLTSRKKEFQEKLTTLYANPDSEEARTIREKYIEECINLANTLYSVEDIDQQASDMNSTAVNEEPVAVDISLNEPDIRISEGDTSSEEDHSISVSSSRNNATDTVSTKKELIIGSILALIGGT